MSPDEDSLASAEDLEQLRRRYVSLLATLPSSWEVAELRAAFLARRASLSDPDPTPPPAPAKAPPFADEAEGCAPGTWWLGYGLAGWAAFRLARYLWGD